MVTNEKLTDAKQIIAYLAEKFPKCFTAEGETKPLKIGIFKDLAERVEEDGVVSRTQLRQALRRYTSSWRYLKCVARGGVRVDLDGQELDQLETEHIEHAAKALEESKARFDKHKKTVKDKKIYKKSNNDTGENDDKAAKSANSRSKKVGNVSSKARKPAAGDKANGGKNADKANAGAQRSGKKHNDKAAVKRSEEALRPLTKSEGKESLLVMVKIGNSVMPGTIVEISKGDDVHIQLNSGMLIKTRFENLFVK